MVEATQNSDTSNSSAVAKAVAALFFSSLAFFFASICSEWLASVYVSEQLHFRLHNVCCLKGMISVLSRSRDCQTLQCSEFEKREKEYILGIVVSYMFYFCWVTLLVRLSYFSSCYL